MITLLEAFGAADFTTPAVFGGGTVLLMAVALVVFEKRKAKANGVVEYEDATPTLAE